MIRKESGVKTITGFNFASFAEIHQGVPGYWMILFYPLDSRNTKN